MVLCFACNHRKGKSDCTFFLFPQAHEKFEEWADMARSGVDVKPSYQAQICSCHFVDGKRANGPTIFNRKKDKGKTASSASKIAGANCGRHDPEICSHFTTALVRSTEEGRGPHRKILKVESSSESHDEPTVFTDPLADFKDSKNWFKREDNSKYWQTFGNEQSEFRKIRVNEFRSKMTQTGPCKCTQPGINRKSQLEPALAEAHRTIASLKQELESINRKVECAEAALLLEKSKVPPENIILGNRLTFKSLLNEFDLFHYYTGFPSFYVFKLVLEWLSNGGLDNHRKIPLEDQLLLTLVKLRLNLDFTDLGVRFQMSRCTVKRIFSVMAEALHSILFPLITIPSAVGHPEKIPPSFKRYLNSKCVVDCVEIKCAAFQSCLDRQNQIPTEKYKTSLKALIACTPSGSVTFVSKLFPGTVSDVELFTEGGFLQNFVKGDVIAANRPFAIADVIPPGVTVKTSSFFKEKKSTGTFETRTRIPIDIVISRMKCYKILDTFFQLNAKQNNTMIFQLVVCLVNLHNVSENDSVIEVDAEPELITAEYLETSNTIQFLL